VLPPAETATSNIKSKNSWPKSEEEHPLVVVVDMDNQQEELKVVNLTLGNNRPLS
jgi:hypothetical protein